MKVFAERVHVDSTIGGADDISWDDIRWDDMRTSGTFHRLARAGRELLRHRVGALQVRSPGF